MNSSAATRWFAFCLITIAGAPLFAQDGTWPQFRGPQARGVADDVAAPVEWNVETGDNVRWKTPIPGLAHSSPIVWGERIYLTTATKEGEAELKVGLYGSVEPVADEGEHQFEVLSLDRASGEVVWRVTAWQGVPAIARHPKGSHAASTPATDGEHVVAFFGTEGLYCFDRDGELKWKRDFGVLDSGFFMMPSAQWGFASSPVLHDGRVYIQCDVQGEDFVAALDVATGEDIWRTARDDVPTWGTPTVDVDGDRRQLIVNGYRQMAGYDLDSGALLWTLANGGDIPVPTPIVAHDLVFLTSAHGPASPIAAIEAGARGELGLDAEAHEAVAWSVMRGGNYMQTPLIYGDLLYTCRDMGVLSCFDARTGERHYRERIEAGVGFTASPVAAAGMLYYASEVGTVHVVRAGPEYELVASNEMGETCMATPAVSGGTLYVRGRHHLFAIANPE